MLPLFYIKEVCVGILQINLKLFFTFYIEMYYKYLPHEIIKYLHHENHSNTDGSSVNFFVCNLLKFTFPPPKFALSLVTGITELMIT